MLKRNFNLIFKLISHKHFLKKNNIMHSLLSYDDDDDDDDDAEYFIAGWLKKYV